MTIKNLYPSIKPSLDLNFARSKTLDPRVTFTRASTAAYYDGKTMAKAEENLLTYNQDFSNSVWIKTNSVVTPLSAIAPDGSVTAGKIIESTATGFHGVRQLVTGSIGQAYTFSVYLKSAERGWALVWFDSDAAGAYFNLSDGTLGTVSAGVTATPGVSVGNGWYRCVITKTITSGANIQVYSAAANNTVSYAGDGISGIYVWGAQLEQRSSATAYTQTTSAPITNYIPALQYAAAGVPRFDHDPITGESKGMLLEESRTNLLTYSDQFDNAAWVKTECSAATSPAIAPDGTLTADKVISSVTSAAHHVSRSLTLVAGTAYTVSFYAKSAGYTTVTAWSNTNSSSGDFNLVAGTASGTGAAIVPVGNGWFRCSFPYTPSTTTGAFRLYINSGNAYAGDGYSGVCIWGAQLEAGAFPTSYIPTTTAQVTRAADSASMTGANFSSWYRPDEGTLLAGYISGQSTTQAAVVFSIDDATVNNRIALFNDGSSTANATPGFSVSTNGVSYVSTSHQISALNSPHKMAGAYQTDNFSAVLDASSVSSDQSGIVPTVSRVTIGNSGPGSQCLNGTIGRLTYYPKRLTDAQLQALTV